MDPKRGAIRRHPRFRIGGTLMKRWEGFHPEVGYTYLDGSTSRVLYFNHLGKHIGTGHLHDNIYFAWIPTEAARKDPRQIVDSKRYYGMVKDVESLHVNPTHRRHRGAR